MKKYIIVISVFTLALVIFLMANSNSSKKPIFEKHNIYDDVDITFEINDVKEKVLMGESYSFVYFKYTIKNNHGKELYFHPGKISVKYNGRINQSTEYDSLSSAMTEEVKLARGITVYVLYFVFKQPDVSLNIAEFEILDSGISTVKGVE